MARTQQDWVGIFEHHRRIMEKRLALLIRFERFLQQLSAGEFTAELQAVMTADIASARDSIAYLEKCQQEAAEERLKLGLACCTEKRQKKSRNRNH